MNQPASQHSAQPPFSGSSPAYSVLSMEGLSEEKEKEKEKEKEPEPVEDADDDDDGDDHPNSLILADGSDMFVMDQVLFECYRYQIMQPPFTRIPTITYFAHFLHIFAFKSQKFMKEYPHFFVIFGKKEVVRC